MSLAWFGLRFINFKLFQLSVQVWIQSEGKAPSRSSRAMPNYAELRVELSLPKESASMQLTYTQDNNLRNQRKGCRGFGVGLLWVLRVMGRWSRCLTFTWYELTSIELTDLYRCSTCFFMLLIERKPCWRICLGKLFDPFWSHSNHSNCTITLKRSLSCQNRTCVGRGWSDCTKGSR